MPKSNQAQPIKSIKEIALEYAHRLKAPIIPTNPQKKTFVRGWQNLSFEDSIKPSSLIRFRREYTNIAIRLGNGLCSIDFDDSDALESFLAINPLFSRTLTSRASRGANLWVRMRGEYPRLTKLQMQRLDKSWADVGEWRADGGYTVIYGQHHSGCAYQDNGATPIEIAFHQIQWPKGIHPFNNPEANSSKPDNFTETQRYRDTEDTDDVVVGGVVRSLNDAVEISTPQEVHTSDKCLFVFCRAIKRLELNRGASFTLVEMRAAFDIWHKVALPYLRPEQSKDSYFLEFMQKFSRTKHPLGSSELIDRVMKAVSSEPEPIEAHQFEDKTMRRLIAILYQFQKASGDSAFYLSSRTCAGLLGGSVTHTTANSWLRGLMACKILDEVEKATTHRAPRFRYKGKI
jgi:hypothetical protein